MCGVVDSVTKPIKDVGRLITHPSIKNLENVGHDVLPLAETVGATALGIPLPLAAAGVSGINTAARGGGLEKSLISAGEGAALSYGGQQLAGAFPETSGSISDAIPNLGIGDTVNSITQSLGLGGSATPSVNGNTSGVASSNMPSTTASAGTGVSGPVSGASAAPAGIGASGGGDIAADFANANAEYANTPVSTGTSLSSVANQIGNGSTSTSTVGSGTTGTQGIPQGVQNGAPVFSSAQFADAAPGGVGPTGSPISAPTSFDKFLDKPGAGTAFDVVKANPGASIAAAGLGLDALKSGQALEGERELKQEAGDLAGQGKELQSYLQSGKLPPGLQQGINQASESAKATIRAQYASRGMSGSSAEQQDLAAVDQRAQAQGAQMAMQLLQTGISETGMASGLYEQLLNEAMKNEGGLSSAISNFASAAAGGGQSGRGGITVNYSGNA